uniref:Class I SAM-dependent methyltransferase n=1 Tax=Schlesneria paludicola TaxID=360056 RepID=A0A7C4LNN7_9PLAN
MSQFSRHVVQPLHNLWESWRGTRDWRQLVMQGLIPPDFLQRRAAAARILQHAYDDYVTRVSTRKMAVSWETACLLYSLAGVLQPRAILDLGSGFSSFVLRSYAARAEHPCCVTSVDDNRHWLKQTETYLRQSGLPDDGLLHWDDFAPLAPQARFELVFHDLGNLETRAAVLPVVLPCLTPGGVLVLDDMHKHRFRRKAQRHARQAGWRVLSARVHTLDDLGRFSEIALRKSA